MITRWFFIFCFSCSMTFAFGQKQEDLRYEITILSGPGTYGTTVVRYLFEGMILRTNISSKYHTKTKIKNFIVDNTYSNIKTMKDFISSEQFSYKKVLQLFEYIHKNNLMNLDDYQYTPNPYYPFYIDIRILDMNSGKFVSYKYNEYCPLFDELIALVNDLVPKEYKREYQIERIKK